MCIARKPSTVCVLRISKKLRRNPLAPKTSESAATDNFVRQFGVTRTSILYIQDFSDKAKLKEDLRAYYLGTI